MKNRRSISFLLAVPATYCFLSSLILWVAVQGVEHARAQLVHEVMPRDDAGAAAAFEAIVPVLRHPRCMNCHSNGDFPRQGDDSHRHTMQIRRGPDGKGVNAVSCSTCHQDHNLAGLHMPPGAPRLASAISRDADDLGGADGPSTLRITQRSPEERSSYGRADCRAYAHATRTLGLGAWRGSYPNTHTAA